MDAAAHRQVSELEAKRCLACCTVAWDRKEADRVMGADRCILLNGFDNDADEVVEVVPLQDKVAAAHRSHRHRKVTEEVPTDVAWAVV